jgi:hypothetical protein
MKGTAWAALPISIVKNASATPARRMIAVMQSPCIE